ncbi:MAG: hypothetical protein EA402_05485 [Planctomycetota bacterium]|nr:MAG: hypothetical protein EA402_05485 [Planctomycetota bacterium]
MHPRRILFILPLFLCLDLALHASQAVGPLPLPQPMPPMERWAVADQVARMPELPDAVAPWTQRGLSVLTVAWEDTGRWQGSSVGPNISDLTIQLLPEGQRRRVRHGWCMPVIRMPNFSDITADVPIDRFYLPVGNERGQALRTITLAEYLRDFALHQHSPTGRLRGALIGPRDKVVLASAQAAILPIPRGEEVLFGPVLFNYQTRRDDAAVLAILVTPEGSSAQIINNDPQASAGVHHGQRLYHNANGQRAPLRARRLSEVDLPAGSLAAAGGSAERLAEGLSLVMVIQIPLTQQALPRRQTPAATNTAIPLALAESARSADVESAVIDSGPAEGPWLGLQGQTIERDWRFPIRVTVQYYQASDGPMVSAEQVARISDSIHRIYRDAEAVGSLVVDGSGQGRATAHQVNRQPPWPAPWWQGPCEAYTASSGEDWRQAMVRIRSRLGEDWQPQNERELRNALELVRPR